MSASPSEWDCTAMDESLSAIWLAAFPEAFAFRNISIITLRLLFAALFGGLIGLQRERQRKSAGLRTHMLVALGAALFVTVPVEAPLTYDYDVSRVVQGVATGVGFLGGGAILKFSDRSHVRGLTSAATIWLTAGLGVAIGLGQIMSGLIIVVLAWLILSVLGHWETAIIRKTRLKSKPKDGSQKTAE